MAPEGVSTTQKALDKIKNIKFFVKKQVKADKLGKVDDNLKATSISINKNFTQIPQEMNKYINPLSEKNETTQQGRL